MLLSDVFASYLLLHPLRQGSAYQLNRSYRLFGERLARVPTTEDLTAETVSAWVAWLQASDRYSPATVHGHRGRLLILWRFAHRKGWAGPVDEVRAAPRPDPMPEAWTLDELRSILDAIERIDVVIGTVPMRLYLRALVQAAYETGLRRSDLWAIRQDAIRDDGTIMLRQSKTGRVHAPQLSIGTTALVRQLPGAHPLAWPGRPRKFYQVWGRVLHLAGVPPGCLHRIRRTSATYVARDHGDDAARHFLGHRTPEMLRHYVDRRIAQPPQRLPPRIA